MRVNDSMKKFPHEYKTLFEKNLVKDRSSDHFKN
jgi:hypothetical protein